MKGNEASYTFNLKKAKMFPKRRRIVKATGMLKREVIKHTREKNVLIAPEVNEFLHLHSKNIPEKISVVLRKGEGQVFVYIEGGTQLAEAKKRDVEEKKKKADKEKKADTKKEEPKKSEGEIEKKEEEKTQKLEDKKTKEKAGQAAQIKRKTGRT